MLVVLIIYVFASYVVKLQTSATRHKLRGYATFYV